MKTYLNLALIILVAVVGMRAFPSAAAMSSYMEGALIDVCKAAQSDNTLRLKQSMAAYNLVSKTVSLKVVCNGENIIDFATNRGAFKTAEKLNRSLGGITITDVAYTQSNKWHVSF